jgi:ribonuclease T2
MRAFAIGLSGAVLIFVGAASASADVPMTGTFAVNHVCAAYQSIRKGTNPGAVTVEANKSYEVLAGNKPNPTHYRVRVVGAEPAERWVSAACGDVTATEGRPGKAARTPGAKAAAEAAGDASGGRATHVMAMGWEPAFCASHRDKSECQALKAGDFAATHLSLHGLWPQPRGKQYCNVPATAKQADQRHDWNALPEPELSEATRKRLAAVMPGVQSNLQRHEWIVHGTCYGASADGYFARAAGLAEAVDASKVSKLFADSVGRSVSASDIRAAFDEAFGAGAGARVSVSCNGQGGNRRISELIINLAGDVTGTAALGDLMRAAQAAPAGCPGGVVVRAPN